MFDTKTGIFKRLVASDAAKRAASTMLNVGKDAAKKIGKKAIDLGKEIAVDAGKRLLNKAVVKVKVKYRLLHRRLERMGRPQLTQPQLRPIT